MTESDIFKIQSTVFTTSIIQCKHDIAFLRHINVPSTRIPIKVIMNHLCMRPSININNSRIFFIRVKIRRFNQTIIKIRHPICRLNSACFNYWHSIFFKRIFRSQKILHYFPFIRIHNINNTRNVCRRILINSIRSGSTNKNIVHSRL